MNRDFREFLLSSKNNYKEVLNSKVKYLSDEIEEKEFEKDQLLEISYKIVQIIQDKDKVKLTALAKRQGEICGLKLS